MPSKQSWSSNTNSTSISSFPIPISSNSQRPPNPPLQSGEIKLVV
ncbi:hypothetical protein LINGRAHAP2_LOCUS22588 [Linum grandiflorum]